MDRTCSLETMVRDANDRRSALRDEDLGEALRAAVLATQAKINRAFADSNKVSAKLKHR